ncbi:Hypothetical protein FKW44_000348, partial [Caligus rogercresseyi]
MHRYLITGADNRNNRSLADTSTKMAHILLRCFSFNIAEWPNENSRWRPFFKMATIENTDNWNN